MATDCEQWRFGPVFEMTFAFLSRVLNVADPNKDAEVLRLLGIQGPWSEIHEVGNPDASRAGWSCSPLSYGLLRMSYGVSLGVKILPDVASGLELLVAIPPRQLRQHFGPYPWVVAPGWVTTPIIQLHRDLIDKCRALHSLGAVRAALLQDEAWTFDLPDDASGIFVHPDVAAAAALEGRRKGHLFAIPF